MKLLFVNSSLTDGGSEKAMALVAMALSNRGHEVTMVLAREKERTYAIDPTIKLIQLRYGPVGRIRKHVSRLRKLRRLVKFESFDYVICYMWDLNVTTLLATLGLRQNVVVSERAFPGVSTRGTISRFLEQVLYRFAYKIVYQTREAQKFCPPQLRYKSVVIPNIIEPGRLNPSRGPRTRRVVSVGRLGMQKNFPLLLRSFARFARDYPDWTLEIYGRGALEEELRAQATHLGIASSVVFAGYVDDVAAHVHDAGMFVLSSDYEGISNAMSEAMAIGLPVVCTNCPVGGAALLIENRTSGILVPVGDQTALTNAMKEVASDEGLARQLSEGARTSVARFTPERMVEHWEERVLC